MVSLCRGTTVFVVIVLPALCATTLPLAPDTLVSEDACSPQDEECSLSLRQLRGELQAAEVQAHVALGEVEDTEGGEEQTEATHGYACVGKPWHTEFNSRLYHCGVQAGGQAPAAAACMSKYVGQSCGYCMGQLASCGVNCINECCAGTCPTNYACKTCNKQKCYGAFYACAGVYPY
mmetsp:Transcript_65967/g.166287  ORF Transcript_65967/g.166287 Transcript_65967/m.166287 type:complete len:177 (+) Transcript_65967:115-645(+)|eukprot:CAMPEP_0115465302 /NCGR_PEP_ID=MMETSP0271-20121206/49332_1 /TAXON_ID=71861 /ORGANISM="Scrippsiella trochoidea, Strain CCMP3099" /LENGTH=176 /DNA_ID=CAMNT_0002892241 /DNA_START=17 /DNA_END=547 /DNA_ORIENTATION=+